MKNIQLVIALHLLISTSYGQEIPNQAPTITQHESVHKLAIQKISIYTIKKGLHKKKNTHLREEFYNSLGKIDSIKVFFQGHTHLDQLFKYDYNTRSELTAETHYELSASHSHQYRYSYDSSGKINLICEDWLVENDDSAHFDSTFCFYNADSKLIKKVRKHIKNQEYLVTSHSWLYDFYYDTTNYFPDQPVKCNSINPSYCIIDSIRPHQGGWEIYCMDSVGNVLHFEYIIIKKEKTVLINKSDAKYKDGLLQQHIYFKCPRKYPVKCNGNVRLKFHKKFLYNSSGLPLEIQSLNKKGRVIGREVYEYDPQTGFITAVKVFQKRNRLVQLTQYSYLYRK